MENFCNSTGFYVAMHDPAQGFNGHSRVGVQEQMANLQSKDAKEMANLVGSL
jgi:hypothetical protein